MSTVLFITKTAKNYDALKKVLSTQISIHADSWCTEYASAKQELLQHIFQLVIVDAPKHNTNMIQFAKFAAQNSTAGILLLVDMDDRQTFCQDDNTEGVLLVTKPVRVSQFQMAVQYALTFHRHFAQLQKENRILQEKLSTAKLIYRAKCVLMEQHMTEQQAHDYIEQTAMRQRKTKKEIAESIIQS